MKKTDKILTEVPAQTFSAVSLPTPPARKSTEYLQSYRGYVYSAITAIATEVASIELKLYTKRTVRGEVETEEVNDHESVALLNYVNNFTSFYQLIELTQTYLELTGEAFWGLIRKGGRITDIWVLRPDWMSVIPDRKKYIGGYLYKVPGDPKGIRLELNDVVPFKYPNPSEMMRGYGAVQAAAMDLDISDFSAQWQRAFFYNSAMPGIILSTSKKMSEKDIQRLAATWEGRFQGPGKAHQIAILSGADFKVDTLTGSLSDMDLQNLRTWERDAILSTFKVSKANIGETTDVNRAVQEATDARFMKQVIKPKMVSLVTQLNEFYLPLFKNTESLFFDFKDPVPADTQGNLAVYESGLKYGWLTINEVRDEEGLEPLEGGDIVYLPMNIQPIDNVGKVNPLASLIPGNKPPEVPKKSYIELKGCRRKPRRKHNVTIPVRDMKAYQELAEARQLTEGVKGDLVKLVNLLKDKEDSPEVVKDMFWRELIAQADVWETQFGESVTKLLYEQREEVIKRLTIGKSKGVDKYLFNLKEENTRWLQRLLPFLRNIISMRSRVVFSTLGMDNSLELGNPAVEEYLRDNAGGFIKGINETTRQQLKDALAEGVRNGEGIPQLSSRVKDIFDTATTTRLKNIARTEVMRASNFSTLESYNKSGVVIGKEWIVARDQRLCPTCSPLDGKKVGANELFDSPIGSVQAPPLHPSCRCTIGAVLKGEELKQVTITELRKGHALLKKMEKEEIRLQKQLDELETELKVKYEELEKGLPQLKDEIKDKYEQKFKVRLDEIEIERQVKLEELRVLRDKALKIVNE